MDTRPGPVRFTLWQPRNSFTQVSRFEPRKTLVNHERHENTNEERIFSRALRDIASSGEISRVMLAIKTVLAGIDDIPVLIFDEIDANIGGVVAGQVGQELRRLSSERQILCITHLPQVAAGAVRHFHVAKRVQAKRTTATLSVLASPEREREIARMLGDASASGVAREHAAKLIAQAAEGMERGGKSSGKAKK